MKKTLITLRLLFKKVDVQNMSGSIVKNITVHSVRFLIIFFVLFLSNSIVNAQSCVIDRVPSSASVPQQGGTTYCFSIITYSGCNPIFTVSNSWLSYNFTRQDNTHGCLYITATANTGIARTGYVYVDNKESLKIRIDQSGLVTVPVTGVSVNPSSVLLNTGNTSSLYATVAPSNATNKTVVWESSNSSIATVDRNYGYVTAISRGTAIVTATTVDGGFKATSKVVVSTEPKSFSWGNYITPAKDQLTQGPCFLFASVAMIETKYKIQNNTTNNIDLSEGQLNETCAGGFGIPTALNFVKNYGVVAETCYPYSRSYYAGGVSPYPDCYNPCGTSSIKYKISDYQNINLSTIDVNQRADYLKSIIEQNGSVALCFSGTSLHNGSMHAYELYGWNNLQWILKDSWPGQANASLYTDIDIPEVLASHPNSGFDACYIIGVINVVNNSQQSNVKQPDYNSQSNDLSQENDLSYAINNNQLRFSNLNENADCYVQIFKIDGQLLYKNQMKDDLIDISNLSKGMYVMKVYMDGTSKVFKFIKN